MSKMTLVLVIETTHSQKRRYCDQLVTGPSQVPGLFLKKVEIKTTVKKLLKTHVTEQLFQQDSLMELYLYQGSYKLNFLLSAFWHFSQTYLLAVIHSNKIFTKKT